MSATPVRIFCGADRSQQLAMRVLEHSIRRHSSLPVALRAIDNTLAPPVDDPRHAPYTEFSFGRFAIPALCGHAGRAVYLDSDMLVFRDIAELWEQPFAADDGTAKILIEVGGRSKSEKGKQAAVMLMDCSRLPWDVADIVGRLGRDYDYNTLMGLTPLLADGDIAERIPAGWNDLDSYDPQRTRLLHYTTIRTQPWVHAGHPHGQLWVDEVARMLAEGALDADTVRADVHEGYARPSLLPQLGLAPGPRPGDTDALHAFDRQQGFVPHRRLTARFAARKKAIAAADLHETSARHPWLAPWYRLRFRLRHGTP